MRENLYELFVYITLISLKISIKFCDKNSDYTEIKDTLKKNNNRTMAIFLNLWITLNVFSSLTLNILEKIQKLFGKVLFQGTKIRYQKTVLPFGK